MEARELSPGQLTGSKLEGVVRLDKLAYSDAFAERYTGRLLDSRRAVYVTVFNQLFQVDPGTTKRVETARAMVGSPMPPQINTLLQTHFDKNMAFLIESEPRGPSVRTLLDEKRSLPWADAVRITANLARAMQWLHEQGVPHCSFHPTSIFVTKLQAGHVVVGDWSLEAVFPPDSAERQLQEDPTSFAGYVDYMAPELARGTENGDTRSAVYALGCVLYEMILGKVPLPGKSAAEVLKRHRHEKPVRLSIAVDGGDLPGQLDDILDMMLAKDPDKRFQSPAAAIAALSNLVDESPEELAPPLARAAETDVDDLYRTIDMDSVDRAELERIHEQSAEVVTQDLEEEAALLREAKLATGGAVSGISATSDVDDTTPERTTGKTPRPLTGKYSRPATAEQDATHEALDIDVITKPSASLPAPDGGDPKKTLMMGSLNAVLDQEETELEEASGRKKTLLHFNPGKAEAKEIPQRKKAPPKLSLKKPTTDAKADSITPPDAAPNDETIRVNTMPEALKESQNATLVPGEADATAIDEATEKASAPATPAEDEKPTISLQPEDAEASGQSDGSPELDQYKNKRDQTREIDRSEWFSGNQDDVWESSLAREAEESSERTNRMIKIGVAIALILAAVGVIAYFESGTDDATATPEEPTDVVKKPTEPEAPKVDVAAIRVAFDGSMSKGRLIEPIGNCAVTHLEELKRHAGGEAAYTEARDQFVEGARGAARKADQDGDLRSARALAGYASQFAPDDAELAKMTADFQARFTGVASADAGTAVDAGAPDAGAPDMAAAAAEPPEEPVVAVVEPVKPKKRTSTKPKKRPKKFEKPAKGDTPSSEDAASLAKEARAAHSSGDLKRAKALYQSAISADGKNSVALGGLGKVYFDQANYRDAIKYQTKAVRYAPGRNDFRIALGQSYYRLGKYSEAIGVWERVLARDPNNSTAKQYVELAKRKLGR